MSARYPTIIRIGGTAYSGSTALDLMLGNATDAFSCGEVFALFRPYRLHHFYANCACGDAGCDIWAPVRDAGEDGWVQAVRSKCPGVRWLVDSSKDLNWIVDQNTAAADVGISVKNLIIWKIPADYAYSRLKRGKRKGWLKAYVRYHERYLSIVDDCFGVPYGEIARAPATTLRGLCKVIGMPYVEGKEQYWKRRHHTLYGSYSARLHLYERGTDDYQSTTKSLSYDKTAVEGGKDYEIARHKSIYYEDRSIERLPAKVVRELETSETVRDVVCRLQALDFQRKKVRENEELPGRKKSGRRTPSAWYYYHHYKRLARYLVCLARRWRVGVGIAEFR